MKACNEIVDISTSATGDFVGCGVGVAAVAVVAAEAATAAITKQINAKTIEQLLANMRQKIKEQQSRA